MDLASEIFDAACKLNEALSAPVKIHKISLKDEANESSDYCVICGAEWEGYDEGSVEINGHTICSECYRAADYESEPSLVCLFCGADIVSTRNADGTCTHHTYLDFGGECICDQCMEVHVNKIEPPDPEGCWADERLNDTYDKDGRPI